MPVFFTYAISDRRLMSTKVGRYFCVRVFDVAQLNPQHKIQVAARLIVLANSIELQMTRVTPLILHRKLKKDASRIMEG